MISRYFNVLYTLLLLGVSVVSFGQERPLGTWKIFMPYGQSVGLCDAGELLYCASSRAVFSYEKESGVIQTYNKVSGLSDINVKTISYDKATKVLVIAYENSNIDLIYNGTDIYNIPDIKEKATSSSITVYHVSFYNGNAYISSDVGISVINLTKKEISNTYIIGTSGAQVKVYATSSDGVNLYAATDEGVKYAPLASPNLQNYTSWNLYGPAEELPQKKASHIECFNGKVYAVIAVNNGDTLYEFNGAVWSKTYHSADDSITSLRKVNNTLYFSTWDTDSIIGRKAKIDATGNLLVEITQAHARPLEWFESNGTSWEADAWNGLFKNYQGNVENIVPDGPFSPAVYDIEAKNNIVKIAPGGVNESWGFNWNADGFFVYKNGSWTYRNQYTDGALQNYSDILSVATVAASGKTYYGSFLSGLIEVNDQMGAISLYDKTNSLLEGALGDESRTKISALTVDNNGNLWIGNAGTSKPIKMIKPDGTWKAYTVSNAFSLIKKITIDSYGQLWCPVRRVGTGEGVLVWTNNGTPDDPSDDVSKILTTGKGSGALPDAYSYCAVEDKEGNIWVGTNQGIGIFYCPGRVLTSNGCDADQIKVERDGYVGYLFGSESVRAIAVDAANRKWIGTNNGLWLISADGKTELLKFTETNSPLPANQITDIAIEEQTGEVFIGTIGGLVSYQGDAMSECKDCDGALVYPNPIKPDYSGPIAIKGLADNAYVKITDVAGVLIYQGRANGTQMIWDGKGYNGERAKSGVYLVFSSTDLGKEKEVAKILITN